MAMSEPLDRGQARAENRKDRRVPPRHPAGLARGQEIVTMHGGLVERLYGGLIIRRTWFNSTARNQELLAAAVGPNYGLTGF